MCTPGEFDWIKLVSVKVKERNQTKLTRVEKYFVCVMDRNVSAVFVESNHGLCEVHSSNGVLSLSISLTDVCVRL